MPERTEIPIEKVIELVQAAIDRVKNSRTLWQEEEFNLASTTESRKSARQRCVSAEVEFGCQAGNVERILKEKLNVEPRD